MKFLQRSEPASIAQVELAILQCSLKNNRKLCEVYLKKPWLPCLHWMSIVDQSIEPIKATGCTQA